MGLKKLPRMAVRVRSSGVAGLCILAIFRNACSNLDCKATQRLKIHFKKHKYHGVDHDIFQDIFKT
jgi:hypothetical protein